jgi:hypothetical protein
VVISGKELLNSTERLGWLFERENVLARHRGNRCVGDMPGQRFSCFWGEHVVFFSGKDHHGLSQFSQSREHVVGSHEDCVHGSSEGQSRHRGKVALEICGERGDIATGLGAEHCDSHLRAVPSGCTDKQDEGFKHPVTNAAKRRAWLEWDVNER